MKKHMLSLLLAGAMAFSAVATASAGVADEGDAKTNGEPKATHEKHQSMMSKEEKLSMMAALKDQLHQLSGLKKQSLELQIQIVERKDKLFSLMLEAANSKKMDALKAVKDYKKDKLHPLHKELRNLHKKAFHERKAFKKAMKSHDVEKAKQHLNNKISIMTEINKKLGEKVALLDHLIGMF